MKVLYKTIYLLLILFLLFFIKFIIIKVNYKKYNKIFKIQSVENNTFYDVEDYTKYTYAKLFYQNPYEYNKYIYILTNNVKENDYVANDNGFVGIVEKTYNKYAKVKLITNDNLILQIMINNCYGIYQNKTITNIDNDCEINLNDKVYTSDLNVINNKIEIGYISSIIKDSNLNNKYIVKLNYNNNLKYFYLISRNIYDNS